MHEKRQGRLPARRLVERLGLSSTLLVVVGGTLSAIGAFMDGSTGWCVSSVVVAAGAGGAGLWILGRRKPGQQPMRGRSTPA